MADMVAHRAAAGTLGISQIDGLSAHDQSGQQRRNVYRCEGDLPRASLPCENRSVNEHPLYVFIGTSLCVHPLYVHTLYVGPLYVRALYLRALCLRPLYLRPLYLRPINRYPTH